MIEITARINGIDDLYRKLRLFDDAGRKALDTSIRVEGFRLMRLMQRQIRAGVPGGRRLAPLSFISRITGHRNRNEPLKALSQAVKYVVTKKDPVEFKFGFVGPVTRTEQRGMGIRPTALISRSWLRIAYLQQAGFAADIGDRVIKRGADNTTGAYLARWGARQSKRRGVHHSRSRYFFLRRSTRRLRTPARPIVDPFWRTEAAGVEDRIRANFRRKLAGERI